MKQRLQAIALALFLFVALPLGGIMLLWKDRCVETRVASVTSPDGAVAAATVFTDCGEKMKVATSVRVFPVSDPTAGDTVLVLHGKTDVAVTFSTPTEITFTVSKDATVVTRHSAWKNLTTKLEKL